VFLADAEGRLLRWNKAAEQMAGAPLAGRSVVAVAAEDQPVVLEAVREALEKGRAAKEVRLRGPRGEPVPYYCVAVRYDTDQGPRLVGIGIDLSERKHLEAELRQAHKMEAIGRLAGGVAHDFNNLLTVIASYGELLLASLPPGDSRRDDATSILEAVKRAASLTRQLLTFGRQSVLEPKVLDLNAVVRETERLLRRVIGEDIELDTRLDPSCHAVRVDPDQLGQVLMNLAANARDAMPWGGRLSIATRNVELDQAYCESHAGARPGTYVELAVSDTGTGIPPEVKARIFEPYFTTKELGKGSGLGLAVVYGIVKQSCGYIEVHSEPGAGTTFRLYFPAMAGCPVIETAGAHPRADPAAMPVRGRNETVLVVEDEDQLRQITARALEKHGYRVLSARGAEEALQLVAEEGAAPDLLVTDVVMPGPSGRQLAETLQRRYPGLKTVFMSGYADDAVIRHGLVRGEITYLQKPFSLSDLVQKVREALDDR
jgi:PAS domain S-box-containing protein